MYVLCMAMGNLQPSPTGRAHAQPRMQFTGQMVVGKRQRLLKIWSGLWGNSWGNSLQSPLGGCLYHRCEARYGSSAWFEPSLRTKRWWRKQWRGCRMFTFYPNLRYYLAPTKIQRCMHTAVRHEWPHRQRSVAPASSQKRHSTRPGL